MPEIGTSLRKQGRHVPYPSRDAEGEGPGKKKERCHACMWRNQDGFLVGSPKRQIYCAWPGGSTYTATIGGTLEAPWSARPHTTPKNTAVPGTVPLASLVDITLANTNPAVEAKHVNYHMERAMALGRALCHWRGGV